MRLLNPRNCKQISKIFSPYLTAADEGISGTRAEKRPEFKKLINDCYAGKIDLIITKSVSRFARNTVECLEYVRKLKTMGIGIFFEEQNINTLTCDSELYLGIYAGFAQSESESMSKNITWTYRKKFEEGKPFFMYKNWLGYKKGPDGIPEIIPEEAAIVERIYDMYLAGETAQSISNILQSENIVIPNKKINFTKGMIANVLVNEKYSGDCILQKTVTIDCIGKIRKKNTGEAPMYYVQNSHPAIINRDKFNRVQEERARRKNKETQYKTKSLSSTSRQSKYALTDVMICGECGSRYKRCTWSKNGKKKIVWRCSNRLEYGLKYCNESPTIEEGDLKEAVVRAVNKFNSKDKSTYLTLMKATIGEAIGLNGNSEEIDLLERQIEALNRRMLDIINDSIEKGLDIEANEDEFKDISEEIKRLENRVKIIRETTQTNELTEKRTAEIQRIIQERESTKNEYDESIVRQMIECIKIYHDKRIEVIFGGGFSISETI
ncbi:MAG: recombinase family protein [Ruminococcaceae bacterium]|nr:recombinase family protein [Oscillospiraceae bacterium]